MSIDTQDWQWLHQAGYKNCCFISYPRLRSPELSGFASRLQRDIEEELGLWVSEPRVFLDERYIAPGTMWPESLRENLCHSLCLVAILVPQYLDPSHEWCGREWAAMTHLGTIRLLGANINPIFPVFFRQFKLPSPFDEIQSYDLSKVATKTKFPHRTVEYRRLVMGIVAHIARLASHMRGHEVSPLMNDCEFPERSAFAAIAPALPRFP